MTVLKFIENKTQWNNFLLNQPTQTGIFLQSAEWLDFQKVIGHKTYRLGLVDESGALQAVCGTIEKVLPLGKKYLYSPRSPVMSQSIESSDTDAQVLAEFIKKMAMEQKIIFWRIEPIGPGLKGIWGVNRDTWGLKETNPVQPKKTLLLDLTKSEDKLLAAMHEKTRYNIRLAEKKNIVLKNETFENFWTLMEETTKRDEFHAHPKKYYKTMFGEIRGDGKNGMRVDLKIVYQENVPLAAALIGYFGDTATYLHGASSYEYRNLMAPYFLHWKIIKEAKQSGYKFYDFWGIDEQKWPGVTRFKKGFASEASPDRSIGSGHIINYPGTFDLPINKTWYKIYNLAKKFL